MCHKTNPSSMLRGNFGQRMKEKVKSKQDTTGQKVKLLRYFSAMQKHMSMKVLRSIIVF